MQMYVWISIVKHNFERSETLKEVIIFVKILFYQFAKSFVFNFLQFRLNKEAILLSQ